MLTFGHLLARGSLTSVHCAEDYIRDKPEFMKDILVLVSQGEIWEGELVFLESRKQRTSFFPLGTCFLTNGHYNALICKPDPPYT